MAAQTHTVYIPRVRSDTTTENIAGTFHYYDLADVQRVDWGFKYSDSGELLFKQAFVHLQWRENDTAQRLKEKVVNHSQGTQPPRLIYSDEAYWLLLPARDPIPQRVADDAYELVMQGDVGNTLDSIVAQAWATSENGYADGMENAPSNVRDSCRAIGLAFNNMRQWLAEQQSQMAALQHQTGINHTLLTATSESLQQYRTAHEDLSAQCSSLQEQRDKFERVAAGRLVSLTQEAQKGARLQTRAEQSQEAVVRQANKAKALQTELDDATQQLRELRGHIHNQAITTRAAAAGGAASSISRWGDDPITARAADGFDDGAVDWTVVGGDEEATEHERPHGARPSRSDWRDYPRYGESCSDDDGSCSSMAGGEDDTRPIYTKTQHKSDAAFRSAAVLSAEEVERGAIEFSPAESFQGHRAGFVFMHGAYGTGYYADREAAEEHPGSLPRWGSPTPRWTRERHSRYTQE
jgi:hypothetical protein